MEEPVNTIRRKDLDKFQGQSTGSTGWLNLDHEWLKRKFSILEPDLYRKLFEKDIRGQDTETHKTFVILFDNTKVKNSMRNDSVTPNKEKKIARDDEEKPKDSESSSNKEKQAKKKFVAPISGKNIIPKEYIKI